MTYKIYISITRGHEQIKYIRERYLWHIRKKDEMSSKSGAWSSLSAIRIRPCNLFQFRISSEIMNHFDNCQDSLDWGSARRKASTYTGHTKHRKRETNIHALSGIWTHDFSVQAIKVWASERAATGTVCVGQLFNIYCNLFIAFGQSKFLCQ
jgi:hypothetical protein